MDESSPPLPTLRSSPSPPNETRVLRNPAPYLKLAGSPLTSDSIAHLPPILSKNFDRNTGESSGSCPARAGLAVEL